MVVLGACTIHAASVDLQQAAQQARDFMSKNFNWDSTVPAGTLELVKNTGETVDMTLILMSEWESKLPTYLKP